MPFGRYLHEGVLGPLGMAGTVLDAERRSGGAAAGLSGPLVDLLALARELAVPTLVSAETHEQAVSVQFAGLGGVLPATSGSIRVTGASAWRSAAASSPTGPVPRNSPSTFGHFGRSGSFVWVDPDGRRSSAAG